MVGATSSVGAGSFGLVVVGNPSPSLSIGSVLTLAPASGSNTYMGASVINGGVLVLNGGPVDSPPTSVAALGLATPGLSLAFNGTVLTTQVFSANPANELTITTANGPVVFTRESDNVWTPVVPAP
jgi:hypothetical protein